MTFSPGSPGPPVASCRCSVWWVPSLSPPMRFDLSRTGPRWWGWLGVGVGSVVLITAAKTPGFSGTKIITNQFWCWKLTYRQAPKLEFGMMHFLGDSNLMFKFHGGLQVCSIRCCFIWTHMMMRGLEKRRGFSNWRFRELIDCERWTMNDDHDDDSMMLNQNQDHDSRWNNMKYITNLALSCCLQISTHQKKLYIQIPNKTYSPSRGAFGKPYSHSSRCILLSSTMEKTPKNTTSWRLSSWDAPLEDISASIGLAGRILTYLNWWITFWKQISIRHMILCCYLLWIYATYYSSMLCSSMITVPVPCKSNHLQNLVLDLWPCVPAGSSKWICQHFQQLNKGLQIGRPQVISNWMKQIPITFKWPNELSHVPLD